MTNEQLRFSLTLLTTSLEAAIDKAQNWLLSNSELSATDIDDAFSKLYELKENIETDKESLLKTG